MPCSLVNLWQKRSPARREECPSGAEVRAVQPPVEHASEQRAKMVEVAHKQCGSPVLTKAPYFRRDLLIRLDVQTEGWPAP